MPILTFFNYIYSFTQGRYYRVIGRHTRRYCTRALQRGRGAPTQRALMVAAVGAEEFLAPLLGVSRDDKKAAPCQGVKAAAVTGAMRLYLSALLVALGERKAVVLDKTGLSERDLLTLWCTVFEYKPEDMQRFDRELVPAYQQKGIDGLAAAVCAALPRLPGAAGPRPEALQEALGMDAAAVLRVLEK
jgi:hypothetical protein